MRTFANLFDAFPDTQSIAVHIKPNKKHANQKESVTDKKESQTLACIKL